LAKPNAAPTFSATRRVAGALRLAAQSFMAHKLARVLWLLLKYKEPFNPR